MESALKQPKTLCDHGALKILVNLPLRRLHRDFAQSLKKISLRAEKRRQSNVIRENHSCEGASCDSRGSHTSKRGLVMTDKKGLATLVAVQHQIIITLRRLKTKRVHNNKIAMQHIYSIKCHSIFKIFFWFECGIYKRAAFIRGRHLFKIQIIVW